MCDNNCLVCCAIILAMSVGTCINVHYKYFPLFRMLEEGCQKYDCIFIYIKGSLI